VSTSFCLDLNFFGKTFLEPEAVYYAQFDAVFRADSEYGIVIEFANDSSFKKWKIPEKPRVFGKSATRDRKLFASFRYLCRRVIYRVYHNVCNIAYFAYILAKANHKILNILKKDAPLNSLQTSINLRIKQ
jgi:hypothetical protein